MTVESMFSMNKAVATMSGIRRSLFIEIRKEEKEWEQGLYHPAVVQAIAEPRKPPKSCVTSPKAANLRPPRAYENAVHSRQTL